MVATPPRRLLAVLAAAAVLLTACGGDENGAKEAKSACKDEVPIVATSLPDGFDDELVRGPGGGASEVRDTVTYHWQAGDDRYIDVFRGGNRYRFEGGKRVRVLGKNGRTGKVEDGLAAKVRLGRGRCTRYQFEAFGVDEDEFGRFLSGLRLGPRATDEDG